MPAQGGGDRPRRQTNFPILADGGIRGIPATMAADDKTSVPRRLPGSHKVNRLLMQTCGSRYNKDVKVSKAAQAGNRRRPDTDNRWEALPHRTIKTQQAKPNSSITPVRHATGRFRKRFKGASIHLSPAEEWGGLLSWPHPVNNALITGPCAR